jgi:hypothetical protein
MQQQPQPQQQQANFISRLTLNSVVQIWNQSNFPNHDTYLCTFCIQADKANLISEGDAKDFTRRYCKKSGRFDLPEFLFMYDELCSLVQWRLLTVVRQLLGCMP